jgi:hypothetical protein
MVMLKTCLLVLACVMATHAAAQSINAGRIAYTTPQVSGQKSCSDSQCHTNDPSRNQNRILKGADDPGAIGLAISQVTQMAFLKPAVATIPFADLAAYLGNPGGVTGTAVAQLAPTALTFPSTIVGSSAPSQQFAISNTGSAALLVSSVSSNSAEFTVVSSCSNVAAGASCNVSVGFTPSGAGTRSGTITVAHNAAGGTSTLGVSGTATTPVALVPGIQVTPAALAFGSVTVGSFSGVQRATVTSVGTAPLTLSAITVTGSNFPIVVGAEGCAVNTPIAVGSSCTVPVRLAPVAAGALTATLSISHNASAPAATVSLSGTGVASTASNVKAMVEYRYVPLNYFFVTSRDDDKATLDAISDFQRTGLSFPVYATQVGNAQAISRFYFDKVAMSSSRGSHFYTLLDADKSALTALNPTNSQAPRLPYNEGIDSWAFLPVVAGVGGSCASGQTPVYRLFRNATRFPDDPNHRFTSDVATYNAFVALGWDGEGVNFCVPTP